MAGQPASQQQVVSIGTQAPASFLHVPVQVRREHSNARTVVSLLVAFANWDKMSPTRLRAASQR